MILYLDASALVKRYVTEPGSSEVSEAINRAEMAGTALVSRAEVAAALAKAARGNVDARGGVGEPASFQNRVASCSAGTGDGDGGGSGGCLGLGAWSTWL